MTHYPMTEDQRRALRRDLGLVVKLLGDVAILVRACYDETDAPAWRAGEAEGAVQRLIWALERQGQAASPGRAH